MMFGGAVDGGKILGDYPDDLSTEGPLILDRGRVIPTTPWDAVFKGIAQWAGVQNDQLSNVLPNLNNFNDDSPNVNEMFTEASLENNTNNVSEPNAASYRSSPQNFSYLFSLLVIVPKLFSYI